VLRVQQRCAHRVPVSAPNCTTSQLPYSQQPKRHVRKCAAQLPSLLARRAAV
jgi:hypothetical protein